MTAVCPYCKLTFSLLVVNQATAACRGPIVCQNCGDISFLECGTVRLLSPCELDQVKRSPAWHNFLEPMQIAVFRLRLARNARNN